MSVLGTFIVVMLVCAGYAIGAVAAYAATLFWQALPVRLVAAAYAAFCFAASSLLLYFLATGAFAGAPY